MTPGSHRFGLYRSLPGPWPLGAACSRLSRADLLTYTALASWPPGTELSTAEIRKRARIRARQELFKSLTTLEERGELTRTSRRGYRTSYTVAAAQGAAGTGSGGGADRPGVRRQRHGHPEQCSSQTSLPGSPHRRRIRQRSWPSARPAALQRPSPPSHASPSEMERFTPGPAGRSRRGGRLHRAAIATKPDYRHLCLSHPLAPISTRLRPGPCSSFRHQVTLSPLAPLAHSSPDRLWQQPSLPDVSLACSNRDRQPAAPAAPFAIRPRTRLQHIPALRSRGCFRRRLPGGLTPLTGSPQSHPEGRARHADQLARQSRWSLGRGGL